MMTLSVAYDTIPYFASGRSQQHSVRETRLRPKSRHRHATVCTAMNTDHQHPNGFPSRRSYTFTHQTNFTGT